MEIKAEKPFAGYTVAPVLAEPDLEPLSDEEIVALFADLEPWYEYEFSGHFNLLLVTQFANTAELAPHKERYDAFIEAWGKANSDASTDYAQKAYPGIRKITGAHPMRDITLQ